MKKLIILLCFCVPIIITKLCGQKGSELIKFDLNINVDSSKFHCYSNDNRGGDFIINKKFQGSLIDGICNLVDIPRNSMFLQGQPQRGEFISYDLAFNIVKSSQEYHTFKLTLISYLENIYHFKLSLTDSYHEFESWAFVLQDSTKLPRGIADTPPSNFVDNHTNAIVLQNINLMEVQNLLQIVSGYYLDFDSKIKGISVKIPMDVLKDFDATKRFFKPLGIDVVWSTRPAKMAYLTFFRDP